MLTTTVRELWVLQALCGAESMPLGLQPLKPYIPVAHSDLVVETDMGRQPITATAEYDSLRRAGVIDERGQVDAVVRDWMTVLSKPDREVMLRIRTPDQPADDEHGATVFERSLVICRHQNRYMAMGARYGDEIVIGGVGEAQAPHRQIELMLPILIPAFGEGEAADIDGANVLKDQLEQSVLAGLPGGPEGIARALTSCGLSSWDVQVVSAVTRLEDSAMAVVVVIDYGIDMRVHPRVLTVADTEYGRLSFTTSTGADGKQWMSIFPTTATALEHDLTELLSLPQLA
ncbi:ESX secretion-associated protein EspG [Mycolicibacterium sp. CBMA 226]|uniref:ESX secretion-associated protein EspG n=1 Tax=Mycolicibacterium sp. CBMA 226 TaxID=2606611 RepID=UPI0012DED257|nr:ESX secretion-associated protein EspG [Mycolicibacterium sp. CBMA 226]QGW61049.1 hypothetical protein ICEMyc226_00017 [Mycolicibacterium sp.]